MAARPEAGVSAVAAWTPSSAPGRFEGGAAGSTGAPARGRSLILALLRRDVQTALRRPGDLVWHVGFFVMVGALFPLSLRPDAASLRLIGPGVVWVGALLAVLLATSRHLHEDLRSGWLDQCVLAADAAGMPLSALVAARMAGQWALAAGPVLLAAPLLALQFQMHPAATGTLLPALALGTATIVPLACVAAALAVGARGTALLNLLLVLPLAAPVLVFGSSAVHAAQAATAAPAGPELWLLGAMALAALAVCPPLGALAWRAAVQH